MPIPYDNPLTLRRRGEKSRAFTLIEMCTAAAISILLVIILLSLVNHVTKIWVRASGNIESFGTATDTFNAMTRRLAQAVLNTYWSYDNPVQPTRYVRASELHFVIGKTSQLLGLPEAQYPGSAVFFQAPLGRTLDGNTSALTSRLNATGFFTGFGTSPAIPSLLQPIVPPRYRFRLFEWIQPTRDLSVYATPAGMNWFKSEASHGSASSNISVMGANIIGFFILAEYPLPDGTWKASFSYDSRNTSNPDTLNQLPPRLRVVLAAIDDASASRLEAANGATPPSVAPPANTFQDPDQFDADLNVWENALKAQVPRINWRFFSTTIQIPNARWSVK